MTAFLHHLDQNPKYFKTKAAVAKTVVGKHGNTTEPMQFPPQLDSWNYQYELEEAVQDLDNDNAAGPGSETGSASIVSDYFGNLTKQKSTEKRSDSRRKMSSSESSEKLKDRSPAAAATGTRRSSSISAD